MSESGEDERQDVGEKPEGSRTPGRYLKTAISRTGRQGDFQ